jgi:hypothetical protein
MFRRRWLTALWDLNITHSLCLSHFVICVFSGYFDLIVGHQRLCLRRTCTFRAFRRGFYAKRLTISTFLSCQCHAWDRVASRHI